MYKSQSNKQGIFNLAGYLNKDKLNDLATSIFALIIIVIIYLGAIFLQSDNSIQLFKQAYACPNSENASICYTVKAVLDSDAGRLWINDLILNDGTHLHINQCMVDSKTRRAECYEMENNDKWYVQLEQ